MDFSEAIAREIKGIVPGATDNQECFYSVAILPDNTHKVDMVAMGSATNVAVHLRDVFRRACCENAVGVLVIHNHPSKIKEPSEYDLILTLNIKKAAEIIGIEFMGHYLIAGEKVIDIETTEEWFDFAMTHDKGGHPLERFD